MTRTESEISVTDVSSSFVVIRPLPSHCLPRIMNLSILTLSVLFFVLSFYRSASTFHFGGNVPVLDQIYEYHVFAECDVCPNAIDLNNKRLFPPLEGIFMVLDERLLKLFRFVERSKLMV